MEAPYLWYLQKAGYQQHIAKLTLIDVGLVGKHYQNKVNHFLAYCQINLILYIALILKFLYLPHN